MTLFILIGIAGVSVVLGINVYNGLVRLKNQVDRSWANIDVILKQRFDEIPQLIQVIEQYVTHEKKMIQEVMSARSRYGSAQEVSQKIQASQELSLALKGVISIGEAYPELKSNENFVRLQSRVSELEGMLADRREHYNESVTNLNTRIEQFPDSIFAGMLGYQTRPLFQVSEFEKIAPSLKMKLK